MELKKIGNIASPYKTKEEAPSQGRMNEEEVFELEIFPEYAEGLKDIEGATHLIVLFWCDDVDRETLTANPPWDNETHGVFATRSPARPNPIGFDVVDLVGVNENKLKVKGMDALDGSIILDIKPYSSRSDSIPDAEIEWWDKANAAKDA